MLAAIAFDARQPFELHGGKHFIIVERASAASCEPVCTLRMRDIDMAI
jgi:hypothetical protein